MKLQPMTGSALDAMMPYKIDKDLAAIVGGWQQFGLSGKSGDAKVDDVMSSETNRGIVDSGPHKGEPCDIMSSDGVLLI